MKKSKGYGRLNKRIFACFLSCVLLVNLGIGPAKAEEYTDHMTDSSEMVLVDEIEECIDLGSAETSAQAFGFFSLRDGIVSLKNGNYKDWIDRLDLTDAQVIKDFYDTLVEASDNDGVDDLLIEDDYFNHAEGNRILVDTVSVPLTQEQVDNKEYNQILSEISSQYANYIWAAYAAFDRDYPEIFWLSGQCSMSCPASIYGNSSGYTMDASVYFVAKSDSKDIRSTNYPDQAAIEEAIVQRDSDVNEYLAAVATKNDYEKLVYFNDKLTKTNEYNTSADLNNINHDCRECVSALAGREGTSGPVCEAYARALKVLCDRSNIDCVLVDGIAGGGGHMWNYVKLNDKWYAVDVTWNDPRGGVSGTVSGVEGTKWLLVGSETIVNGSAFLTSHPVSNTVFSESVAFTNGPELNSSAYDNSEKIYITPTFSSLPTLTGVYGQSISEMTIEGEGATTSSNGAVGTWALAATETEASDVPEVGTTTAYTLTFTPSDAATYKTVDVEVIPQISPRKITVKISDKTKKYLETNPAFDLMITDGELVGDDSLNDFKITYSCEATTNSVPGNYYITATVKNVNYSVTVVKGQLTVAKADNIPGNMPESSYEVANTVKTVSAVSLPDNWKWSAADASKTLPAGSSLEVTAEYTGDDADYYNNTTRIVLISRAACEAGDVICTGEGEQAPTCTEDGIGHTECTICGDTVTSEIVVDAKGHQLTKTERMEATEEADGREAYWTCDVCEKNFSDSEGNTEVEDLSELDIPKIVKIVPTFLKEPKITGVYGQKLNEMILEAQTTSEEGAVGSWAFAVDENTALYPAVNSAKSYTLIFTPQDTETYKAVSVEVVPQISAKPITVTVSNKSKIYGEVNPEFSLGITSGELVGTDSLNDFEITYICEAKTNSAPRDYGITAIVTNANYDVTVIPGQLTITKADTPKNAPNSSYEVANTVKTVSAVSLPENWKWSAADASKTLPAGSSLEVTAEYTGDDAACYNKTTKLVTITRAACEAGAVLYTGDDEKEPTCAEVGIGHTECKLCGEFMSDGVEVPATNHAGTHETRNAKAATCEESGYTGDVYCFACGELLEAGTIIPKKEKHTCGKENAQNNNTDIVNKPLPVIGAKLPDPKGEAVYKVSEIGKSVEYAGPVNKKAKKVVIPATVTVDGVEYAVTGIAANAFKGNKKLTNVTLGSNIETIGNKAFYKCTALKKITLPSGVSKIGKQTFYGCKNLKTITIKTKNLTSKNVGSKAFKGVHSKAKFKVPKAKLSAYKKLLKKKGATQKHKITK